MSEDRKYHYKGKMVTRAEFDQEVKSVLEDGKPTPEPMKLFNCTIRLMDTGLPYKDLEDAKKSTQEWADEIAQEQNCTVVDIEVMEDPY